MVSAAHGNHCKSTIEIKFYDVDWELVKTNFIHEIVKAKFLQNEVLKAKLLSTDNEELIEGNNWGDRV